MTNQNDDQDEDEDEYDYYADEDDYTDDPGPEESFDIIKIDLDNPEAVDAVLNKPIDDPMVQRVKSATTLINEAQGTALAPVAESLATAMLYKSLRDPKSDDPFLEELRRQQLIDQAADREEQRRDDRRWKRQQRKWAVEDRRDRKNAPKTPKDNNDSDTQTKFDVLQKQIQGLIKDKERLEGEKKDQASQAIIDGQNQKIADMEARLNPQGGTGESIAQIGTTLGQLQAMESRIITGFKNRTPITADFDEGGALEQYVHIKDLEKDLLGKLDAANLQVKGKNPLEGDPNEVADFIKDVGHALGDVIEKNPRIGRIVDRLEQYIPLPDEDAPSPLDVMKRLEEERNIKDLPEEERLIAETEIWIESHGWSPASVKVITDEELEGLVDSDKDPLVTAEVAEELKHHRKILQGGEPKVPETEPETAPEPETKGLDDLTVKELRARCSERKLNTKGKKAELIERLNKE